MIEFFVPMKNVPTTTHQQKKVRVVNGKPIFYEPEKLADARSKLEAHLSKHVPDKKFTGPVELQVVWCFDLKGNHKDGEYRSTKPDCSNIQKLLEDVMTSLGFWKDDNLIVRLIVEKFWAELPGIYIKIVDLS